MSEGPVFYNNSDALGNDDKSLSNFVTLGDGLIKVYKDTGEDRVLAVSFIEEALVQNIDQDFNLARIGGIPLSVSVCSDVNLNPSGVGIGFFYALDVIMYSRASDAIDNNTVPSKPVVNGVEVGVAKVDDLYYLKTYQVSTTPHPTGVIHFGGVPMAYGSENELLIRDSGYTVSDIHPDRYEELKFFGVPVRVGYVDAENKYYLIIDPYINLTSYIVAQYKMNDNRANTTVVDAQGFSDGTNQVNTSSRNTTGITNGALQFNGGVGGDYIDTNSSFQSTFRNSFTINFWHRWADGNPAVATVDFFGQDPADTNYVALMYSTGNFNFAYKSNNIVSDPSPLNPYSDGQETWHMITFTVNDDDGSNVTTTVYNDGVQIATDTSPVVMSVFTQTDTFWIGASNNAGNNNYEGDIDNFCIFNKTLTQGEIDFLYNDGNGTEELSN
jgi:hypothetical protein